MRPLPSPFAVLYNALTAPPLKTDTVLIPLKGHYVCQGNAAGLHFANEANRLVGYYQSSLSFVIHRLRAFAVSSMGTNVIVHS